MTREETYEHLLSRGMLPSLYNLSVGEGVVSFALYDFGGKQVGYQEYRPFAPRNSANVREARYFTYLPRRVNGYFGAESLKWWPDDGFYVVEGVFKAAKLHKLGQPALALMGSEVDRHLNQLNLLHRPYLAIGDNDAAGQKFARKLGGIVSPIDLDEMTDEAVEELLSEDYK